MYHLMNSLDLLPSIALEKYVQLVEQLTFNGKSICLDSGTLKILSQIIRFSLSSIVFFIQQNRSSKVTTSYATA